IVRGRIIRRSQYKSGKRHLADSVLTLKTHPLFATSNFSSRGKKRRLLDFDVAWRYNAGTRSVICSFAPFARVLETVEIPGAGTRISVQNLLRACGRNRTRRSPATSGKPPVTFFLTGRFRHVQPCSEET
ncbi:MAG TPA: hypothetical protein DEB39_00270, partial [Planctomycetaceae bacterium]|nr:hypothetical protein [Planctomycetaceae bacterium]